MSQKLSASRAECEKLLNERIEEVRKHIDNVSKHADFYEAYEDFVVELDGWREFTKDILKRMFPDPEIARQFNEKSSGAFHMVASDDLERFDGYKREIKSEIGFLQTCIKKLAMFDEPQVSQQLFSSGQHFTAFQAVTALVKNANQSIFLIDGYVDDATLSILSASKPGISLQILTKNWSAKPHFKTAVATFGKQHGPVDVRLSEDYHDRFIIIDDTDVHQVGSSLKDLGNKAATLVQLTTPKLVQSLIAQAKADWAIANKL